MTLLKKQMNNGRLHKPEDLNMLGTSLPHATAQTGRLEPGRQFYLGMVNLC
jgi:hypothetical protein